MVESRPGLRAISYSAPEAIGTEPFVEVRWDGLSVRTRLVGDYNRSNIAAAIAVGLYFGIGRAEIVSAIESYDPDNNRSQKRQTAFNTLISDCYNANPSSMQAALDNFLREADPRPKAVVLGDMGELGPYAAVEHRTVIERLEQGGIEEAYLVGGHFAEAARGSRYRTFADTEALARYLDEHPIRNRLVLVKGSRANRLEKIAEKLYPQAGKPVRQPARPDRSRSSFPRTLSAPSLSYMRYGDGACRAASAPAENLPAARQMPGTDLRKCARPPPPPRSPELPVSLRKYIPYHLPR